MLVSQGCLVKGLSCRAYRTVPLCSFGWVMLGTTEAQALAFPEKDRQHLSVEVPGSWVLPIHSGFRLLFCGVLESSGDHLSILHALGARNGADPKRVLQDTSQVGPVTPASSGDKDP